MNDQPALELQPPDISARRSGNAGVDFVHVFDSMRPGPTVLVQALTHGNEICGAIALEWLFARLAEGLRLRSGRLTLVYANVEAFARFDASDPHRSRFVDEDLNRVWADESLDGPRDSAELRRARRLKRFVD